jgi:hypothetical protein
VNKTIILHHLLDMNDLPAAERWFYRYHIPEVMRNYPVMTRYVSYRAVPPPPGAEKFGYYNYKIHENISSSDQYGQIGLMAGTKEVVPLKVIMVNVPLTPTEDFMGKGFSLDEKTVLRWVIAIKYPEGVSLEEGDKWYLNVHAKEVMKQPGLTRFFSYRIIQPKAPPAGPGGMGSFLHPNSIFTGGWHRISEQWYENSNGWVNSIIKNPPKYTKPKWAKYDKYPFLEPDVDFGSTFILERPTDDWMKEIPQFYI